MRISEPMRVLGPRPCPTPRPLARDPTTHQSHPPAAPWVPEAPGPALRSGTTTRKIHQLTVNAEIGDSLSGVPGPMGFRAPGSAAKPALPREILGRAKEEDSSHYQSL